MKRDAIVVKVRDTQMVQNKPVYIAVGVDADGEKHVLRIWLARTPPQTATAGKGARRSSPDPARHLTMSPAGRDRR
jgi:Transposase, Mutator family